jgi:hypothetical protein
MKLDRARQPKTYSSFYTPKQRIAARDRSNATIAVIIGMIALVAVARLVS